MKNWNIDIDPFLVKYENLLDLITSERWKTVETHHCVKDDKLIIKKVMFDSWHLHHGERFEIATDVWTTDVYQTYDVKRWKDNKPTKKICQNNRDTVCHCDSNQFSSQNKNLKMSIADLKHPFLKVKPKSLNKICEFAI